MTAATPMMMPSMVSRARILLVARLLTARRKDWEKAHASPSLSEARGLLPPLSVGWTTARGSWASPS